MDIFFHKLLSLNGLTPRKPGRAIFIHVHLYRVTIFLVSFILSSITSFNIDTKHAFIHSGDPGSMFGYSVAQHRDQGASWLLIGAPKAQTNQQNVIRGGAVFRCKINSTLSCDIIPFDTRGNNIVFDGNSYVDIEQKSHQWFGAVVQTSGPDGLIVACSPRRVYYTKQLLQRNPIGGCIVSYSATQFQEFSPCQYSPRGYIVGYHRQSHCLAGTSVTITEDKKFLLIGAPGSWYWQGQVFAYDITNMRTRRPQYSSPQGPQSHDDSYLGSSSATGNLDGDGISDYIVGVPRGNDMKGKVTLLRRDLSVIANISGSQIGSYFGYSVVATDLNRDSLDDVVVGAPYFSKFGSESYETGKVYIYYQSIQNGFRSTKRDSLTVKESKSRFGYCLSVLKDVNSNKFNDLAVGAPWTNDGEGAVYIFQSSLKGIVTSPSQIIKASQVDKKIRTFGFSLSSGLDLDENGYPDLLIGAYAADKAVFLRSRPVVRVEVVLKAIPSVVDLSRKECSKIDGTAVTCFSISACMVYDGLRLPPRLKFDVSWNIDAGKKSAKRIELFAPENRRKVFPMRRREKECITEYGYFRNNLRDKLSLIDIRFKIRLHQSKQSRDSKAIQPVMDKNIRSVIRTNATIENNCGKVCYPDLSIRVSQVTKEHIIGSNKNLEIKVIVDNLGEDSFESMLFAALPYGVRYQSVRTAEYSLYISCGAQMVGDRDYAICDIGNPLPSTHRVEFLLLLSTRGVNGSSNTLPVHLTVNSSNPENSTDTHNNWANVHVPVSVVADLHINGVSQPQNVSYTLSSERRRLHRNGFLIVHTYEILNRGPSTLSKTELRILWPSYIGRGDPLLQLEGPPEIPGGSCVLLPITPRNASKYVEAKGRHIENVLTYSNSLPHTSYSHQNIFDRKSITCSRHWCTIISCQVGWLAAGDSVILDVTSRLSSAALIKYGYAEKMNVMSVMLAKALEMPYAFEVNISSVPIKFFNVTTLIVRRDIERRQPVAIWIIVVSVICGLLLLFLLIVLLWWFGFFKRKRLQHQNAHNGDSGVQTKH